MSSFIFGLAIGILATAVWNASRSRHASLQKEIRTCVNHLLTRSNRLGYLFGRIDKVEMHKMGDYFDEIGEAIGELATDLSIMGDAVERIYKD
jgi:hypothetical protein